MERNWGKLFLYWLVVIVWMAFIFSISSIPNLSPGFSAKTNIFLSKLAHITEYALLTLLLIRALRHSFPSLPLRSILEIAFIIGYFYAVSDEFHQLSIIGREGTFRDVMIDTIGITLMPLCFSKQKKGR